MGFDHVSHARRQAILRAGDAASKKASASRAKFLQLLAEQPLATREELCAEMGIALSTYRKWRQRYPEFGARVDEIKLRGTKHSGEDFRDRKSMDFAQFRKTWLGMDTPWFQMMAVDQYQNMEEGHTVLILWPPEHGKTTLFEDFVIWKFCFEPLWRVLGVTEASPLMRQIIGRIQLRLQAEGPFPDMVAAYGPFAPTSGQATDVRHPWTADRFTVWGGRSADQRSYSFEGIGWKSAIAGRRCNHLHVDDMQSLKSLEHSQAMFNVFRQDMVSRPGPKGRTSINGTRVGDDDFYETLMDQWDDDMLTVVKFPAIVTNQVTGEQEPLWPHDPATGAGYTLEMLDLMRRKVGEDAWWRNYMQEPRATGSATYDDQTIERSLNPLRSVSDMPHGVVIGIGLDPAIGSNNAFVVAEMSGDKLRVLKVREDVGLARNEQIMQILEDLVIEYRAAGNTVTDVVIEAMAFQRGLSRDERLRRMREKYGFRVSEHLTGINKYDENIGVASMASSFLSGQVELPYADDKATRAMIDPLIAQLRSWKPKVRGTKLRQDQVMALWFLWIRWRMMVQGRQTAQRGREIKVGGLPFKPTKLPAMTRIA